MQAWAIINPQAGTATDVQTVIDGLGRLGITTVKTTSSPGDAKRLAHEAVADGCELVVAAGGDGTINEVVNGLATDFAQARLGIIPLGTGNDFVRSVNIPTERNAALKVLDEARAMAIDVVSVTSDERRYFINVSAGGFSGLVDEKLTSEMKRAWGPLAYLRSAAMALPDLTDYHTYLTFDDEEQQEVKTYNIVVANARFVAGGIPIAPQAELDDGLFDVMIVPVASLSQLALVAPKIMLGQHVDDERLLFRRARKLRVDSQPKMWFNADGELVGNEPSTFELLPRALNVIVGPEKPAEA
ncbi:MAG: diacylglycerol kinase family lipid kinase, partial [Chloroflexota bacterium]|nr:diacylglycerol kinase family lipid kinase [Chloroflexota bacterium]